MHHDEDWQRLTRWIRGYSWAQIAFLALLLGTLHAVPLLGAAWSSCLVPATGATNGWCVAFFHLYEPPLVAYFVYHLIVGLRPITPEMLPRYAALSLFQLVLLVVFVTFESNTLLDAMARGAPAWEVALIFGGCAGMIVDSVLGGYVVFARVLPAALDRRDAAQR
jgi:hypothetical protein